MPIRASARALLLATAALLGTASGALAQERGVRALLDQANFWRGQNQPGQALQALSRVLVADPDNAEALALQAQLQAESGDRAAAERSLSRLRAVSPNDPRLPRAELGVRGAAADPGAVAEARRLASSGQGAAAIARYRQIFGGNTPPDSYALEYYQALAGSPGGFEEGRAGLSRLAQQNPSNRRFALSYAQALTWREASRAEGIRRLSQLAAQPEVAQAATAAWRDAVLWEGANRAAIPDLEAFLQRNPNDAAVRQRLEEARVPPPAGPVDVAGQERDLGFTALNAGRLADAARVFEGRVAANPADTDALGGLGVARLRQNRFADAQGLLERAIAGDPAEGERKWGQALRGAVAAQRAAAEGAETNAARQQIARGQLDQAEATLLGVVRRNGGDRADAEALLGDIALRRGDPAAAESRYRAALARRANLGGALSGLYEALRAQNRMAEADELAARSGRSFGGGPGAARAQQLRAEAGRAADAETSIALLRAAVASAPNDPWARLDLARQLLRAGRGAEGRALVEDAGGTPDGLYAAALFAQEEGRSADAAALVNRIPARLRNADQNRLLARSRVEGEVAAAAEPARYGRPDEARARLLAIAARPDPGGETAAMVVRALGGIGDPRGAAEAARVAAALNRGAPPAARIALADAMLSAGLEAEATEMARSVQADPRLSADERRQLAALGTGLAVRASDRLNEQGDQARAFDRLQPALRANPTDPTANLALGRLYQGARGPREAQRVAEAVLARDPRNAEARGAAVEAALSLGQWRRAEELLSEARAAAPNDPRTALLEARLARAADDPRRAQAALLRAAELRRAEIGAPAAPLPDVPGSPGARMAPAPGLGDNPFRRASTTVTTTAGPAAMPAMAAPMAAPAGDALLGEIGRQLAEVGEEAATRLQPSAGVRVRSGTAGLDRLREFSAGGEASAALPGIGGRLTVRAQAVALDAGTISTDDAVLSQIGSAATGLAAANAAAAGREAGIAATLTQAVAQADAARLAATGQAELARAAIASQLAAATAPGATPAQIAAATFAAERDRAAVSATLTQATQQIDAGLAQANGQAGAARAASAAQLAAYREGLRRAAQRSSDPTGVTLAAGYTRGNLALDIGSTPLGFRRTNLVGGVEFAPELTPNLRLRFTGERRAMTDSVLAWSGIRDPLTGRDLGAVTRAGGRGQVEFSVGRANLYAGGGYYALEGQGVQDNNRIEAGAGIAFPIFRRPDEELTTGLDLVYQSYDRNLRFFTAGHGGYFSPQRYMAGNIPLDYRARSGDLSYRLGGSVGVAHFREDRAPYFPTDNAAQAALVAATAGSTTLNAFYAGQSQTNVVGSLRGDVEYALTRNLRIGALLRYDRSADWNEGRGMLFARYRLD